MLPAQKAAAPPLRRDQGCLQALFASRTAHGLSQIQQRANRKVHDRACPLIETIYLIHQNVSLKQDIFGTGQERDQVHFLSRQAAEVRYQQRICPPVREYQAPIGQYGFGRLMKLNLTPLSSNSYISEICSLYCMISACSPVP